MQLVKNEAGICEEKALPSPPFTEWLQDKVILACIIFYRYAITFTFLQGHKFDKNVQGVLWIIKKRRY